jgi:hypothetical protein
MPRKKRKWSKEQHRKFRASMEARKQSSGWGRGRKKKPKTLTVIEEYRKPRPYVATAINKRGEVVIRIELV